ncbi:hypothetical protein [Vibrio jasicida]|uniref:hypothetical protein n=1 Tax=Vibrio jasicida TaxID=766224 RepID=UPI001D12E6EE|nr:hypothetical protein [Vibrio jasicida]
MKRKFSLLRLILLSFSSQAATNNQPEIDPYTYLLYGAKTESNAHIDVKTFTGNTEIMAISHPLKSVRALPVKPMSTVLQ